MILTAEEEAMIEAFDHTAREVAIGDISEAFPICEDKELLEDLKNVLKKLRGMTDEEFEKTFLEDENGV
jgi:hypothetical protein